jgi:hypothetical protein
MCYLNRIIFINSAQIKYAEINLNGNVHFIGTQGVGKSTLLRAILFFYNADASGLGLGTHKQKLAYKDYYFNYSNSYIIYEVVREDGKFCVVSYKSQNRVCFRFFNSEYKQDYFIDENKNVPDNWEGIAQRLDANKVFYTKRKIEEYKEYRDIIYGNNNDKKREYKRFSLLESKDYQQVPKTIQNVFLNSKMETEIIKQTIILSLDNNIQIDLNRYAHELNDFETQFMDIRKFKTPATSLQAENIVKFHIAILHLENEKIELAKELSWAVNENNRKAPELTEQLKIQQEKETTIKDELSQIENIFDNKIKNIEENIFSQQENLKKAKELSEEYLKKNIYQIIAEAEKKNDWEKENHCLETEKKLLLTQFVDLETKYKTLLDNLENQLKDFLNSKNHEKNKIYADFLAFQNNTTKNFNKQIADIREELKTEIKLTQNNWEEKKQIVNNLKITKERTQNTQFFEKEIADTRKQINELTAQINQIPKDNENLKNQIQTTQKQWNLDEENLQKDFDRNKNDINTQIKNIETQILEIESRINNNKDCLYGWLTTNYPDWEKTIGKVIDEKHVLFNSSLNPRFTEKSNNLYGVEIDLSEINKTVKTVSDYENEKTELNETIKSLKENVYKLSVKLEEDKDKLKKKYLPKITENKNKIRDNEWNLDQKNSKHSEAVIKLAELNNNAKIKLDEQLARINTEIEIAVKNAKNIELEIKRLEEKQNEITKTKENEHDQIINTEENKKNTLIANLEADIKVKETDIAQQKKELADQQNKELSEKGADTKRINEIDGKLSILRDKLQRIEKNRDLVTCYYYDKKKYFDKVSDFTQEKQKLEKQLETEKQEYKKQQIEISNKLSEIQTLISDLTEKLENIKDNIQCFTDFKNTNCFDSITEYFLCQDNETQTEKSIKNLIDEIKSIYYEKLSNQTNELRAVSTDFLSKFSENNIFKFKKQIATNEELFSFAEMLRDFVEECKIELIEKEVNKRFASIVSTIGQETTNMQAESGKIQALITKINYDFVGRDIGTGIIKKIELKIEDSKNEIVQLLLMIKKFNDDNSMEFGEPNLFSSGNHEKKNKEAVDLLKQFVKKISETRSDSISLSDSFELKFRVVENQNDTGWVEKLSNVGSEGTDTLVKAMVNIMLLNVFKESVSKHFRKDFHLHCMMDEIGKLHPSNMRGIMKFANARNIWLINGSPVENDACAFTHIYKLHKDEKSITRIKRILTQITEE